MKISIIILVVLAALTVEAAYKHKKSRKWAEHARKHGLDKHSDDEQEKHFENFDKIDQLIEKHNSQENPSFLMEHNKFSHLDIEKLKKKNSVEVIKHNKGGLSNLSYKTPNGVSYPVFKATPGFQFPESFDWTQKGWSPVIKSQGDCENCYAISSTSALEFALWKKTKQNTQISIQEITDCASSYGNFGCNRGVELYAFDYILKNNISQEVDYPYVSSNGKETQCRAKSIATNKKIAIKSYISAMDELSVKEALIRYGPITVIVDPFIVSFYKAGSGIISNCKSNMGHSVLIVGYGVEKGKKYWKIQNSWGKDHGDKGYFKMSADDETCLYFGQSVVPVV